MTIKRKIIFFFFIIILSYILIITPTEKRENFFNFMPNNTPNSISVLTANVGNLSLGCRSVLNNLCYKEVEQKIADKIKILNPDIISFQELLAPWQCEQIDENNIRKVCSKAQVIPQIRRLVGGEYSIACTSRNQFECVAVHTRIGQIMGCSIGELCNIARTGIELSNCDNGFSISAITVNLHNNFTFDIVNVHPQSSDSVCRTQMLSLIFEQTKGTKPLIQEDNVLIMGDFNLDPWRDDDESTDKWKKYFEQGWAGKPFSYHSGIVETAPPNFTSFLFLRGKTVDFIVSNFANGTCSVLGESTNTTRLDGGKGMDHRAIFGILWITP